MKILIIGAGAFGVSTAIQLQKRFNGNRNNNDNSSSNVEIVVLDRAEHLPAKDAASTDINKVVRADYGDDQVYTDLALESIQVWKKWNKLAKEGEGKGGILEGGDEEFTRGPLYFQDGFLLLTESEELNDMERLSMETLSVKFKNNSSSTRMSPIQQLLKSACDDDDHQVDQLKAFGAKFPAFQDTLCRRNYRNGYLNTAAGWCNSGEAMRFAINMARELGVVFINGPRIGAVTELVRGNDTSRVSGVRTLDGSLHMADVVIVAAGSWTPSLIPELVEGGLVVPTAQPVVHLILPTHLRAKYSAPSCTVWSADITKTGFYGFPCNSDGILKIGHHGPGYLSPTSKPSTSVDVPSQQIPLEALEAAKTLVSKLFPELAREGGAVIKYTRLCWYSDSWDGDWYITPHPHLRNLVIASGGSGHAMKFLPILGSVVESVLIKVLQEEELMSFTSSDPSPPPRSIYTKFLWRTNNSNTREEKKKQKESTRMEEVDGVVTRRKVLGDTNLPLADPNRDFTFDQKAKL